jgi:starvation-inducible DNA-binding protein
MDKKRQDSSHTFAPSGLEVDHAEEVAGVLQDRLADLIDLSLTLKHVHWNVVGFGFIAIHKLMDEQVEVVRDLVDATAERIATLGGSPAGLIDQVTAHSHDPYPLDRASTVAHLGALEKYYEQVCAEHREAIEKVDPLDPVSGDLLIGHTAALEMNQWFIRAHLTDAKGNMATTNTTSVMEAAKAAAFSGEYEQIAEDAEPVAARSS